MRAVFSGWDILSLIIFPVPCGRKRVGPNVEFINIRLAIKGPDKFPFRIVDAEADRPLERRREETDPHGPLAWRRRRRTRLLPSRYDGKA